MEALRLDKLCKSFSQGGKVLGILKDIDLVIEGAKMVGLVGASGAGKSTLLQIAGLLDQPSSGAVFINGVDCGRAGEQVRTEIRRDKLGFVYQFHHLMSDFSAIENVMMPLRIAGVAEKEARLRAADILERLGLAERMDHVPAKLSGGEQQRTAIARAVVHRPALLLADEPTGNLDEETSAKVFDMLIQLIQEEGLAALIATHDHALADRADKKWVLKGGYLHEDM